MANKVGDYEFITLTGVPDLPGMVLEDISRPGVNGVAVREVHKRGELFEMIGVRDVEDANDARLLAGNLKNLKGTITTIIDCHDETYTDIIVHDVVILSNVRIAGSVGGIIPHLNPTHLITVRFVLQLGRDFDSVGD